MDCVCVPFRGWMGKTKDWSAFEWGMVVGARRTVLCQELQCCWVFHTQQFPVCIINGPPPKGHPANLTQLWDALESTWASITVESWRLVESMTWWIQAVLSAKGRVQLNINQVFLMFCPLNVCTYSTSQKFGHTYSFKGFSLFLLFSKL